MVEDNCLSPILALANDLGTVQVFLLHEFSDHDSRPQVEKCVNEYKKDNRLVAMCLAVEAWMCDEERFRHYLNLDEQAAVEHIVSTGADEEAALAISRHIVQNSLVNLAHMYYLMYGNLALFPASYEGIPFRMESLWGVHQLKAEIVRGVDEMFLDYDEHWRVLAEPGGTGTYTDLLQLDPPPNL